MQTHTAESSKPQYDDLNTPLIAVVGVVSAVLVFAIIVAVQAVYYQFALREEYRKEINVATVTAEDVLNQQRGKLNSYSWVDPQQGKVSVPIQHAMELVLREYGSDRVTQREQHEGSTRH